MEIVLNSPEKFVLRMGSNESLANAVRRSVPEIPILTIDEVEIYKNDSALYDEVIAHRLGLMPLKTEKGMNEKTKVEFKLTKKGPCTVYSEDLKGSGEIVYDKIPITILGEDGKLELVATAKLSKGIEHAKSIPGLCYYRHILEIESSAKIDPFIEKSKGLIKPVKSGSKWICDIEDANIEEIKEIDKDSVSLSKEILFVIESYGNMDAKEILSKSLAVLNDNLDEFKKAVD